MNLQEAKGPSDPVAVQAVAIFERVAAYGSSPHSGAPFAMYNLGVARLYGYGGYSRDGAAAAEWFERSGLPEGLMMASKSQIII